MYTLLTYGILLGYAVISITAVLTILQSSRAEKVSRSVAFLRCGSVALGFFLIPFWDWIPTVAAHSYYCSRHAAFVVAKPFEQWRRENADWVRVQPPLLASDGRAGTRLPVMAIGHRIIEERRPLEEVFMSVKREEARLIDAQTHEVLARYVDFRSGYGDPSVASGGSWKIWLHNDSCEEPGRSYAELYAGFAAHWSYIARLPR